MAIPNYPYTFNFIKEESKVVKNSHLVYTVLVELLTKIPMYGFEFILASWLSMTQYAEWTGLVFIYRLAPYAHLGALSYFNKRYPFLLGGSHHRAARQVEFQVNQVINSLLFLILFMLAASFYLNELTPTLFMVFCGVFIMQIFTYAQAKLRNEKKFVAYAVGLILFSATQFFVAFFTVKQFGVFAAACSMFVAFLIPVLFYLWVTKINYHFTLPRLKNVIRVLKLGLPPFLLTVSSFIVQITDRAALLLVQDTKKLAFYGFFAIFFQIGILAVNSLGKVLGPYIFHLSGQNQQDKTLIVSLYTCYIIFALYLLSSIVILTLGDVIINYYFLTYSGSTLGVYNYNTIGMVISLPLAFYPQLMVAGKEFLIVRINFICAVINFITVYFLAHYFDGFLPILLDHGG